MNTFDSIKKWIQRITLAVSFAGMFLLIPMMLLTTFDVIGRSFMGRPIPGTVELSSYILAVFILFGVAYTQQTKTHVCVSMLTSRLPEKPRFILEFITTLLSIFIISLLAWQGFVVGIEETAVSDMLRISQWPFKLLVGAAAFLLCLELFLDLATIFRSLKRNS